MNVRYYGFFDKTSKAYAKVFPSVNDLTAKRDSERFAQEIATKDKLLANDLETHYLFTIDNETGVVIDNKVDKVFIFVDYFNQLKEMEDIENGKKS